MANAEPNEDQGTRIEYYPDFMKPVKNRSCTDVTWLIVFLVFMSCWAAIGIWAIKNGDPATLLAPRDSHGRQCSINIGKPYLFFFDLTKCSSRSVLFLGCDTPQVCVAKCPNENFLYSENPIGSLNTAKRYCTENVEDYNTAKCPTWFLQSQSVRTLCIPTLANSTILQEFGDKLNQENLSGKLLSAISNIKILANVERVADQVIADVTRDWVVILSGFLFALMACVCYMTLLRFIVRVTIWTSIVGVIAVLAAVTYFSYVEYNKYPSYSPYKIGKNILLTLVILLVIVFAIVLLVLIFLRKRIVLAIELIKQGNKAVILTTATKEVLTFSIVVWIWMDMGAVAFVIYCGVYLATTGDPLYQIRNLTDACRTESRWTEQTQCFPSNFSKSSEACLDATCKFVGIDNAAIYPYLQAINIFGFFWLSSFISDLRQMVLAQVFAKWYWTYKKSTMSNYAIPVAFYRIIRYHVGTLAFGSLIMPICRLIRVCLECIDRKLKKYDNKFSKTIKCCLKCFFWCLEKFLKFINKNAYYMCAIHGKNFRTSAEDAFMLVMRNVDRFWVLDKVTDFLFFLSKVLVTVGYGAVAYIFIATDMATTINILQVNYAVVIVLIIIIETYFIASLCFSGYSMAADTLFFCFLEDYERNEETHEKPYMFKKLIKILEKRNIDPKPE